MHEIEAKTLLSAHNGMNLYRGCQHGCIYCDTRSRCYQFTHAFTDIEVKKNAPELLTRALQSKRNKCMIGTGSMCDPYIPLERELRLTRRCLEIIAEYGFGATVLTKSADCLRDLDLFTKIQRSAKCVVQMTLTTFDESLCRIVEPNVSTTRERFQTLRTLREHGIPTVVWLCPLLPYLNDTEENLLGVLGYCRDAGVYGVISFGMGMTLREGDREYYYQKLDEHFPGLKARYIRRYGTAYEIPSDNAPRLQSLFIKTCAEYGIVSDTPAVFRYLNEFPAEKLDRQGTLFDL